MNTKHLIAAAAASGLIRFAPPEPPRRKKGDKLTPAQIEEIRRAREAGERQEDIAKRYGVSRPYVCRIQLGQRRVK